VLSTEFPPAAAGADWAAVSVVVLAVDRAVPPPADVFPPTFEVVSGPKSLDPASSPPPTALAFCATSTSG
jgi:hypothetical protein